MEFTEIVQERRGRGAWIRLARPKALNTLTPTLVGEFNAALDQALADPAVIAIVVTGTGRAFCAGADLKFLNELPEDQRNRRMAEFLESVLQLMLRLEKLPKPVIGAVNGLATGGGMELLLCCDLVVAAGSARLGDGHANFGLLPGGGGSVRLPRKIGPTRAKYLFFTGELVPAAELVAAGLVNEVVEDAALEQAVERLVGKLSNKSPLGLARMKTLVDDGLEQPREVALRAELVAGGLHAHSFDMREGIAAFNEKRSPQFRGV
ncbi:MAG TPA: enoyl-CoA hydratase/isomerase family protein [Hypericibacter adhaerens]|jgi:enoyl-CoA hydratase/carnithine racemase|uniref:Enoyl-CoA hydratase n=1 Tax=Hypericibacter adhaerens TaxID=2602016 RepID=A0A5J6MSQ8_9PROT|nr:enoyl-CoA hydratase/isomerase family protein [Hypericibacter adhaerens]QEX20343.1 enoyl-CoA hydratase [Hypericibacter adhaerens]HWA46603.1 enoyl-CoA hydratase/isomerase family protein [Hypericibacter adhaerens]